MKGTITIEWHEDAEESGWTKLTVRYEPSSMRDDPRVPDLLRDAAQTLEDALDDDEILDD